MAHMKVYEGYMVKLVKALPMNDVTFTTQLRSNKILPDGVDAHIKSLPTKCDKAEYYLNNVIKSSLDIDETEELKILITVMEKSGYGHVERLAKSMKLDFDTELRGGEGNACDKADSRCIQASTSTQVPTYSSNVRCPKCGKNATRANVQNHKKNRYGHPYYNCTVHGFIEWQNTAGVNCDCNIEAKKEITKKSGRNFGKWFYTCKKQTDQCDYFVWSADVESKYRWKKSYSRGYYNKCRKPLGVKQYI